MMGVGSATFHGVFYGRELLDGRPTFVRFVISDITADSARFEQAFSADGGKTLEVNWIAVDTRIEEAPDPAPPAGMPDTSAGSAAYQ